MTTVESPDRSLRRPGRGRGRCPGRGPAASAVGLRGAGSSVADRRSDQAIQRRPHPADAEVRPSGASRPVMSAPPATGCGRRRTCPSADPLALRRIRAGCRRPASGRASTATVVAVEDHDSVLVQAVGPCHERLSGGCAPSFGPLVRWCKLQRHERGVDSCSSVLCGIMSRWKPMTTLRSLSRLPAWPRARVYRLA